jgi:hypothetical protein
MTIMERVSLSDALANLRHEVEKTMVAGADSKVKFLVEDVTIEFQLVAATDAKAGGGFKFYLFNADAELKSNEALTQKLIMKLKVVDSATGDRMPIAGSLDDLQR